MAEASLELTCFKDNISAFVVVFVVDTAADDNTVDAAAAVVVMLEDDWRVEFKLASSGLGGGECCTNKLPRGC